MKKTILMAAMLAAMSVNAQSVDITVTPSAEQDYLFYATPNDVEGEGNQVQKIVTGADYVWSSPTYRMQHFLVECLAAPADLKKGATQGVTAPEGTTLSAQIPTGAKISGLALPGWLHTPTSAPDRVNNLNAFIYIKNLEGDNLGSVPYINTNYTNYKRMLDNADNGYIPAIAEADKQFCPIANQTDENPHCLDLKFDQPFEYAGDYVNLAVDLVPANDNGVESAAGNGYGAVFDFQLTQATEQVATVYHTIRKGGTLNTEFVFYSGCEDDIIQQVQNNPYMGYMGLTTDKVNLLLDYFNFQPNTLPAFQLTYYTNDLRGKVLDPDGNPVHENINSSDVDTQLQPNGLPLISLYDQTAECYVMPDGVEALNSENSAEVNADGSFAFTNLDYTHTYLLTASSSTAGSKEQVVDFGQGGVTAQGAPIRAEAGTDAIENDLLCDIVMQCSNTVTAVNDIHAASDITGVTYYNPAGMRSTHPFAGVNIVVTSYSDGTTHTSKVVK